MREKCQHGIEIGKVCVQCDKYNQSIKDIVKKSSLNRGDEKKHDEGKPMWDLLPWRQLAKIVDVMTFGANKYGPHQWKEVEDGKNRYFAALMRHLTAYRRGEKIDPESGIHHLAHAGCCLLFMMWLDDNNQIERSELIKELMKDNHGHT
jgi:hypothetical protein